MNHRHQPSTTAAADGLQLGSGLRRIACLAALLFIFVAGVRAQYPITETAFPDKYFYKVVLDKYSMYNGANYLTNPAVTFMDVKSCSISDLTGIMYFPTLNTLDCSSNKLSSLILTGNTLLQTLDCSNNNLSSVNLSQNALLTTLTIYKNRLRGSSMDTFIENLFDRSQQPTKGELRIIYDENASTGNKMTSAQVEAAKKKGWTPKMSTNGTTWTDYPGSDAIAINSTNFPDENFREWLSYIDKDEDGYLSTSEIAAVKSIDLTDISIRSLKGIEYFTALKSLDCEFKKLTELDVSKNTALAYMYCRYNQLASLDVSNNTALRYLICEDNQLTTLDVSNNTALLDLTCSNNQLTSLDVSKNTALTELWCYKNQLTSLDVSKNTELMKLYCYKNQIRGQGMTDLVNSLPDRRSASVEGQLYVYRDETPAGNLMTPKQVGVATSKNWSVLRYDADNYEWVAYEGEPADGIEICKENFPDDNFRAYVSSEVIDRDGDGYLSDEEIVATTEIDVSEKGIKSLSGIGYFKKLEALSCFINQLTSLDVSDCSALSFLNCSDNQLTSLDLSKNTALTYLDCGFNQLTSLDLSKNTALTSLICFNNQLTSLDMSHNTALERLECYSNQIRGAAMTTLVNSLPDRKSASEEGTLLVYYDYGDTPEGNMMSKVQVEIATDKNWNVWMYDDEEVYDWVPYEGETLPGDANGDGEVDITDIDCLRDYILGLDPQPFSFESANLNGDSEVDIQDLTQLIEILLKR